MLERIMPINCLYSQRSRIARIDIEANHAQYIIKGKKRTRKSAFHIHFRVRSIQTHSLTHVPFNIRPPAILHMGL